MVYAALLSWHARAGGMSSGVKELNIGQRGTLQNANNIMRMSACAQVLYQKQGRSAQFGSRAERDEWLAAEATQLETAAAVKRSSAAELEAQVAALSEQLMDLSQASKPLTLCVKPESILARMFCSAVLQNSPAGVDQLFDGLL